MVEPVHIGRVTIHEMPDHMHASGHVAGGQIGTAFTCLLWHPGLEKLICGSTSFAGDLLHTFDPATGEFECLDYGRFGEPYEMKIHRALELGGDGCVYGASSCLHDVNKRHLAPGGRIFRWDPRTREFSHVGMPCPPDYIQTISLDWSRRMIYGMTYPVFNFFAWSLDERALVHSHFMESIWHVGAIDEDGGYWGTWGTDRNLFRYDPVENSCEFFNHGLPPALGSALYHGTWPVDSMVAAREGLIYIGLLSCEIYALDPATAELAYVGRPLPSERCPSLAEGDDGLIYGVGGNNNDVRVFTYDRQTNSFDIIGILRDSIYNEPCFRPHDIVKVGETLYIGETDNPARAGNLWECTLER